MPQLTPDSRTRLRKALAEHFSLDELDTLCTDLGVDYESVPGYGRDKETRVREIVTYFEDRGRLNDLVDQCAQERPLVGWSDLVRYAPDEPPAATTPAPHARQRGGGAMLLGLLLVVAVVGGGALFALRGRSPGEAGATAVSPPAAGQATSSRPALPAVTTVPLPTPGSAKAAPNAAPTLAPLLATGVTPTPTPPTALNVSRTAARSIKPQLLVDGQGILHLTWLDDTLRQGQPDVFKYDVLHRQLPPNGQWSDITNLTAGFRSVTDYPPQLLRNPAGDPCAIWQGDASRENVDGFYMRCRMGGQWSPAQQVEKSGFSAGLVSAFAPDGKLVSIRNQAPAYTPMFGDTDLSDGLKAATSIQLAVDTAGTYHLVWVRAGDSDSLVYRSSSDGGTSWTPAVRLSTDATAPHGNWVQLVADKAGAVHLVYGGDLGSAYYRRWTPQAGWGETLDLGRFRLPAGIQDLTVDDAGRPHGVWVSGFGEVIYGYQQPDGSWASRLIAPVGRSSVVSALAVDAQGQAHIAWEAQDDARDIYYASVP